MEESEKRALVIGAGLAGSEAAWQLARADIKVDLYEMRPVVKTKAHTGEKCAELVCSNSFRGADLSNAVGLLKEELRKFNSIVMEAADYARVPAGGALAVDRDVFSNYIDYRIRNHPNITFHNEELTEIPAASPEHPVIIATGPLTSHALTEKIEALTGSDNLAFFDAVSPILTRDSIDESIAFKQSRYQKGGDDYFNIPIDKETYYWFVEEVSKADKYTGNEEVEADSLDKLRPFEGCMPIEDMIERGPDTLRFGPFKPVGILDPRDGSRPFAVLQLRQDNIEATLWSMVGMQTRMKRDEQKRIFRALPGLQNAEFVRYGSVHRNTFIDSPKCLDATLEFRTKPGLYFAGQITGVEGYVESTAGGLVAGFNAARMLEGKEQLLFPKDTAIGSLMAYISEPSRKEFQPMNISFGLMPSYFQEEATAKKVKKISKADRRRNTSRQALDSVTTFLKAM